MHAHKNMEIITYVRKGSITHMDDIGNKGEIHAGQIQIMSAGSGINHSEYNIVLMKIQHYFKYGLSLMRKILNLDGKILFQKILVVILRF